MLAETSQWVTTSLQTKITYWGLQTPTKHRLLILKPWQLSLLKSRLHVQTVLTLTVDLRPEPRPWPLIHSAADKSRVLSKKYQETELSFMLNWSRPNRGLDLLNPEAVEKGESTSVMCIMLVEFAVWAHWELGWAALPTLISHLSMFVLVSSKVACLGRAVPCLHARERREQRTVQE